MKLITNIKQFERADIGSMNSRIKIYDRTITAPKTNVDYGIDFSEKWKCWAMIETKLKNGLTYFDNVNIERPITHQIIIRKPPATDRLHDPVFVGIGKNDLSILGAYTGNAYKFSFTAEITEYEECNGEPIVADELIDIGEGLQIKFASASDHVIGDKWIIEARRGVVISSQDWIYYKNQYMSNTQLYDIINVDAYGDEYRWLVLHCAVTGFDGYGANYA